MDNVIQAISSNWHPIRVIYLILGLLLTGQALQSKDVPFALIGGLFLYQSLFNTGCCGMSGAFKARDKGPSQQSLEDTEYTEIK